MKHLIQTVTIEYLKDQPPLNDGDDEEGEDVVEQVVPEKSRNGFGFHSRPQQHVTQIQSMNFTLQKRQ